MRQLCALAAIAPQMRDDNVPCIVTATFTQWYTMIDALVVAQWFTTPPAARDPFTVGLHL
jgi:hypothetical protein